ncbi:helix-turn-helix domain-containing protein [Paenibacillus elgii]
MNTRANGGEERTQREIAKELGISRSYVYGIEKGRS